MYGCGQFPAFLFLAEPEQVAGQLGLRGQVVRIKFQSLTLTGGPFCEAVFLGKLAAYQMIRQRVGWPIFQCRSPGGRLGGGIVFQMGEHGTVGMKFRAVGVDPGDAVEDFTGGIVVFGINPLVCEEQQGGNVVGIGLERGVEVIQHLLPVTGSKGEGQSVENVRIPRKHLECSLELFSGEGVVVFAQGQLTSGEEGLAGLRIQLGGCCINFIQNRLGIFPHLHQSLSIDDNALDVPVGTTATACQHFLDL